MSDALLGLLKFSQFLGLVILIGASLFQIWILPIDRPEPAADSLDRPLAVTAHLDRLFGVVLLVGPALVAVGAVGQAAAAAAALPGVTTLDYLIQARVGRFLLARAAIAVIMPGVLLLADRWLQRAGAAALAVVATYTVSAVSHAARHGDLAVMVDMAHMVAAGAWVGGLLSLAVLPWQRLQAATRQDPALGRQVVGAAARRFSQLGGIAVIILVGSGLYSASLHVYGSGALAGSPYGQALAGKLALFVLVLAGAFINRFWVVPELLPATPQIRPAPLQVVGAGRGSAQEARPAGAGERRSPVSLAAGPLQGEATARHVGRLRRLVRWEAGLAVIILAVTGVLSVLPPVDRPAQLAEPVELALAADRLEATALLTARDAGDVAIELVIHEPAGVRRAVVEFDMIDHAMARQRVGLVREGERYVGEVFLAMPGAWRASWLITTQASDSQRVQTDFSVGATPGYAGSQLNIIAAFADLPRGLQATAGLLAAGVAVGLMAVAWMHHAPGQFIAAVGIGALGLMAFLNVAVLEAFPTTPLHNPVQAELGILNEAGQTFARECADCHGAQARGDGLVTPPVPDARLNLRDPMVQARTDGDLYWLVSEGRQARGMPGFAEVLDEETRWALVHHIRAQAIGALAPDDARHHLGLIGLMFVMMSIPALLVAAVLVAIQARQSQ